MLLPRVLTAVVGIPLLLFLIHWGGLSFDVFVAGVAALCVYEYGVILAIGRRPVQRVLAVLAALGVALSLTLGGPVSLTAAVVIAAVMLREMAAKEHSLDRVALTLFGVFFLAWMPAHLALIRDARPYGERLTFMLFVSVWVMDTAAYFVGRSIGQRKLAPVLSPKKTWEGAIGGFFGCFAVVFLFRQFSPDMLTPGRATAVALTIGVCGQVSDLAESLIKRAVGVKDSGALLPGHGGVMDRFDSFILAAPAVYYCLTLT